MIYIIKYNDYFSIKKFNQKKVFEKLENLDG